MQNDYISREALIAEFKRMTLGENSVIERFFADGVYAVIETFPAADVRPVVHATWEPKEIQIAPFGTTQVLVCANCGYDHEYDDWFSKCPNCGAMMGGNNE